MPSTGTHDITIEDASAATPIYGYMLAQKRNGASGLLLRDFRSLAPRTLSEGQISEAQFDPAVEYIWTQTDWSLGLGGINERDAPNKLGSGYKVDTSQPGRIILARDLVSAGTLDFAATSHRPTGFAIVGTEVWAFIGRDVYSLTFATNAWVRGTVPEAAAKIYRNGVNFEGNTFAPGWVQSTNVADTYIYKADADANWTLSTLANSDVKYMAVAGGLMYGANWSDGVNLVRTSADPTNAGAWSTAYTVGGADVEITALIPNGNVMLICKPDGIYTIHADGTVVNEMPGLTSADLHPDNCKGAYNWNGIILMPVGLGGVKQLQSGVLSHVHFNDYAPRDTQLHGRVVAISGNHEELYIMVLEADNTRYHVLKALWVEVNGGADWAWHHVARQAYTTGTDDDHNALFAEGVPSGTTIHRRVWAGISSTGSTLGPFYIPSEGDTDDVYTNDDDGEAQTSAFDAGMPMVAKHFSTLYCETDNLGAGANDHNIQVRYRLEGVGGTRAGSGTAGWTLLGTLTQDQQTLTFGVEVTGRLLELLFLPIQGTTTTTTPELHKFSLRCQLRPATLKTIPLVLDIIPNTILRNGLPDRETQAALVQLRTWAEGAAEVVVRVPNTADPTAARSFSCVFLKGFYEEEIIGEEWLRAAEVRVRALLAEVST